MYQNHIDNYINNNQYGRPGTSNLILQGSNSNTNSFKQNKLKGLGTNDIELNQHQRPKTSNKVGEIVGHNGMT